MQTVLQLTRSCLQTVKAKTCERLRYFESGEKFSGTLNGSFY